MTAWPPALVLEELLEPDHERVARSRRRCAPSPAARPCCGCARRSRGAPPRRAAAPSSRSSSAAARARRRPRAPRGRRSRPPRRAAPTLARIAAMMRWALSPSSLRAASALVARLHPARILVGWPARGQTPFKNAQKRAPAGALSKARCRDRARRCPPVRSCCSAPGSCSPCTRTPPRRRRARRAPSCEGPRSRRARWPAPMIAIRRRRPLAALLLLAAAQGVRGVLQRRRGVTQLALHLLVLRDGLDRALAVRHPRVGLAGGLERVAEVVAQLLVLDQPLHVRCSSGPPGRRRTLRLRPLRPFSSLPLLSSIRLPGPHSTRVEAAPTNAARAFASGRAPAPRRRDPRAANFILLRRCSGMSSMSRLVAARDDQPVDPGALRGERLLLQAADRQHHAR